jgi:hypothetical protein
MPEYSINRWDSVIIKNNVHPMPMIYIKPDESFYKDNNNQVLVYIRKSSSKYDDRPILGYVYNSADFPNNRPNFWNETKCVIIVLSTNWAGYPDKLGNVFIEEKVKQTTLQEQEETKKENTENEKVLVYPQEVENFKNNSFPVVTILLVLFFVILAIILMFR